MKKITIFYPTCIEYSCELVCFDCKSCTNPKNECEYVYEIIETTKQYSFYRTVNTSNPIHLSIRQIWLSIRTFQIDERIPIRSTMKLTACYQIKFSRLMQLTIISRKRIQIHNVQ